MYGAGSGGLVREVVAEHSDIQLAHYCFGVDGRISGGNLMGQPDSQGITTAWDTQQDQVLGSLVGFKDLVGDTSERTIDIRLVEDNPGRNLR